MDERKLCSEFFQLFKTPWELYDPAKRYDAVLATCDCPQPVDTGMFILFSSTQTAFDDARDLHTGACFSDVVSRWNDLLIPIYGNLTTLGAPDAEPLAFMTAGGGTIAVEVPGPSGNIVRVGYDLFREFALVFERGQAEKNAASPTLDIHIQVLRRLLVRSGSVLVEIPPVPHESPLFACLTHDVDNVRIRDHVNDHTMWGFLYRATAGSLVQCARGRLPFRKLIKNWGAALSLPLVLLGLKEDFWLEFPRYRTIEAGVPSTFYMMPFRDRAGAKTQSDRSQKRQSRYDVTDIPDWVEYLTNEGCEIGVHGIDAWHDPDRGREELARVSGVSRTPATGIRMHWLWFDGGSPRTLEEAGFSYDSTLGYNTTIGFRNGTAQVFLPPGAEHLLELPMILQDVALMSPHYLNATEEEALAMCNGVIDTVAGLGGVVTTLWHTRSLSPERLWDQLYTDLIKALRAKGAWFGSASEVVDWFRTRRSVSFESVAFTGNELSVRLTSSPYRSRAHMSIRVHLPHARSGDRPHEAGFVDFPWSGETDVKCMLPIGDHT